MTKPNLSIKERLEIHSSPEPNTGCTLWMGAITVKYGKMRVNKKYLYVHRLSWEQENGPIPEGMYVCHKCDVGLCINPDHLFVSDHAGNMADMVNKGRSTKGTKHGYAKLDDQSIRGIRLCLERRGYTEKKIGSMYGVTRSNIYRIKAKLSWTHV